jgi:hypothetical protein
MRPAMKRRKAAYYTEKSAARAHILTPEAAVPERSGDGDEEKTADTQSPVEQGKVEPVARPQSPEKRPQKIVENCGQGIDENGENTGYDRKRVHKQGEKRPGERNDYYNEKQDVFELLQIQRRPPGGKAKGSENILVDDIDNAAQGAEKPAEQSAENRGDGRDGKHEDGVFHDDATRGYKGKNARQGIDAKEPSRVDVIGVRVDERREKRSDEYKKEKRLEINAKDFDKGLHRFGQVNRFKSD